MLKHDRMRRVVLSALVVMLVASLLLAVASHVTYAAPPTPPRPTDLPCPVQYTYCWVIGDCFVPPNQWGTKLWCERWIYEHCYCDCWYFLGSWEVCVI
jgi:hypothetical protein